MDSKVYKTGRKLTKQALDMIHIKPEDFHPEWNYTILPSNN
ncbi:MAG: ISAzo13-like element transposase-related protein [Burkholderiales bacterium]